MAEKAIYLYQVTMGHGSKEEQVAYCYARNAGVAIDNYKIIFKEKKYDIFRAKKFGEADIKKHKLPFEPMPKDEVEYIMRTQAAKAEAYAQRKAPFPEGEFIPLDANNLGGNVV